MSLHASRWPLLLLALMACSVQAALTFPALTGHVIDEAHVINSSAASELEQTLRAHETATSNQIVVVTLTSLQDTPIEDYGYQLGRHWGIGQKGKNNGVLIIVVPSERQARIEVGYGLEGVLTDAMSRAIIQSEMIPAFRAGDYSTGVVNATRAVVQQLSGEAQSDSETRMSSRAPHGSESESLFGLLVAGGIALGFFLKIFFGSWKSSVFAATLSAIGIYLITSALSMAALAWIVVLVFLTFRGGGGGPWHGGGRAGYRGGYSGGGGSFGGGGASGRW